MDRNSKTSKKKKSLALNKKIKTNKRIIDQKPKNKSRVVITKLKGRRHNLQNSSNSALKKSKAEEKINPDSDVERNLNSSEPLARNQYLLNLLSTAEIPSPIIEDFKRWIIRGVNEKELKSLKEKYKPLEGLEPQELNDEIAAMLDEETLGIDKYMYESQQILSSAITALNSILISVAKAKGELDKVTLTEKLCDVGKLISSFSRR